MAAALLSRKGSIAAGRSAAYLHGLEGFGPAKPVILIGADENARSPLARVIRSTRFESVSTVRRRGFLVTNEPETILTLSRELSAERLEALVDWILARQGCTAWDIHEVVEMSSGMPGIGKLRPIVDYRLPDAYQPPSSELERLLYRVLDDPRLPSYTRQMPIQFPRVEATVDAYLAAWRLIVEGDGRRWHNRRADHERDRLRDNEATAQVYAVLRFTYQMLRDRPGDCLETVIRTGWVRQTS
jgi:very-short-patch-repair endonuclease